MYSGTALRFSASGDLASTVTLGAQRSDLGLHAHDMIPAHLVPSRDRADPALDASSVYGLVCADALDDTQQPVMLLAHGAPLIEDDVTHHAIHDRRLPQDQLSREQSAQEPSIDA